MLGATPRCAACGNLAYHAEQVMGPGRKIYHKPCLQCINCKKRLDPGALVEHDTEPYCKRCHGLLFGTRDLRSANVFSSSTNAPPVTPPRPSVGQQSSPKFQESSSSAHQADHQIRSSALHSSTSPRRLFDQATAHASPLSSSWIGRQTAESRLNDTEQTAGLLENKHEDQVVSSQKRPLPRLPPKPAPLHSNHRSSTNESANPNPIPSRDIEHSESVHHEPEDNSERVGLNGSHSMERETRQESQPLKPAQLGPPPARDGASPGPHSTEERYTSIDDAINSATTTTDHIAQLTLETPAQPKVFLSEAITTPHNQSRHPSSSLSSPRKNPLLVSSPYRSKPIMPARSSPSGNELCAGCGKTVYFAEGVNAIGKRWHKPCLRCTSCRSTVDPGRVQDRDELPYCRNCYTRDFGPTVLR